MSINFPHVELKESGKETIKDFLQLRKAFISEGGGSTNQSVSEQCLHCPQYQLNDWNHANRITMVHFSMTPAPCQGKCIYCDVVKMPLKFNDPIAQESYKRAFSALDYAENSGLIDPNAEWLISSGEISIHPLKESIYDRVKDKNVTFFTNSFLFDEQIGKIISNNPNAKIELSIDSGTASTWNKVKRVDNFENVVANLRNYHNQSCKADQIILKYILLPNMNDTQDDYEGVASLMKELDVSNIVISRERRSYDLTDNEHVELLNAATEFIKTLSKYNLGYKLHSYSPDEHKIIESHL